MKIRSAGAKVRRRPGRVRDMNWIREHKFISFLVLVIILAAGFLIFAVFTGGGSTGAGALGGTVFGKITEPVARLGQNISGVFSAGSLREKNEELSRRNRELQEENRKLRLREDDTQDLEALKKALRYKGGSDTEQLISGDVTAMNDSRWIRTFTINLGKEDGVKTGSVVVNGDGLVGTVKSAGRGWAKVSTILDSSRGISFCLEDSRKTMGILHVSTDGELEGYMLDESAKVRAGDTLVTSGMGVYPERITVGKVKKVTNDEEEKLKRITVETAVQFDGLRKVAVLL
ncbi:rod shape-determining protein MreC [Eubacterium pyruvativorans]|uniref:Cell shape-determining protein MreC n=2 Tax=Eubacterium pyruvativorans TaxID=155865 RepID=A0A1I7G6H8_9FIRM|nr:rod shape-determining protein MreC [Eubacterium pyruvativorans]SFU44082.1 rod shape-determining protein MreC [Eubacterium pyruvativorans]